MLHYFNSQFLRMTRRYALCVPGTISHTAEDLAGTGVYSIRHTYQGLPRLLVFQYILLVAFRPRAGRVRMVVSQLFRLSRPITDPHPHAPLGIEHRRRTAPACIDIPTQRPSLTIRRPAGQARAFRRDKPRLLASRAVSFHVERGDLHTRRRIGTRDAFQSLGDRRAAAPIALGKEIADHAASPRLIAPEQRSSAKVPGPAPPPTVNEDSLNHFSPPFIRIPSRRYQRNLIAPKCTIGTRKSIIRIRTSAPSTSVGDVSSIDQPECRCGISSGSHAHDYLNVTSFDSARAHTREASDTNRPLSPGK